MFGYHASHEQFSPKALLHYVALAEKEGFSCISCSDHFHPWSERQGQSGFSFAWLGAAMNVSLLPFGVVCAPGQRYHPAIIAQAAATLQQMFPSRFWMALGSGEALNECITGDIWPGKEERNKRLLESVQVIKNLFSGERITYHGRIKIEQARLYTLPEIPPLILGAALTVPTARWMGSWADGLITAHRPFEELKEIVDAFRNNGGHGKPVYLKLQLSYARNEREAMEGAYDQWRNNVLPGLVLAEISRVEQFDELGKHVQPEELRETVCISSNLQTHIEWIKKDIELGFKKIFLHNVNRQQELFIHEFGRKVLPQLLS